jgi:hypothetical protein
MQPCFAPQSHENISVVYAFLLCFSLFFFFDPTRFLGGDKPNRTKSVRLGLTMFRRSISRLSMMWGANLEQASDVAFVYPRFTPETHVSPILPELKEGKAFLAGGNIDGAVRAFSRAQDVLQSVPSTVPGMTREKRCVVAAKGALLLSHEGTSLVRLNTNVQKMLLRETSEVLAATKDWDRTDLASFDATCMLLSMNLYCSNTLLHAKKCRGQNQVLDSSDGATIPFTEIFEQISELSKLAEKLGEVATHPGVKRSLRRTAPRLRLLEALACIPATGDLGRAVALARDASHVCSQQTLIGNHESENLKDGDIEEMGIFSIMQASLLERHANGRWGPNSMDEESFIQLSRAIGFYEALFQDIYNRRGGDLAIDMEGKIPLRDAYSTTLLAAAQLYMNVVREDPKETFFSHHLIHTSPVWTLPLPLGAPDPTSDITQRHKIHPGTCKAVCQKYLERALKINRKLYPENRSNMKAAYILRALAMVYAELKDYLFASGLFRSAESAIITSCGEFSYERLELLHSQEIFQRKIGSINEAAVTTTTMQKVQEGIDKKPAYVG